ncbi:MAG: methyltransferase domain-containing protein [Clostridia bacterium]|nr:methyltransferase domain-containing protein [Clostridia bacterium]NCC75022.1 methyltransferase domain-containing protein [Clostridia bacterium]
MTTLASESNGKQPGRPLVQNALALSHEYARLLVRPGDTVIDATCGNGGDTEFLADLVGPDGHVIGFDIQSEAIARTTDRLQKAGLLARCELHVASHDRMAERVPPGVRVVLFNLGYLPRGNHAIGTRSETTLPALDQALALLSVGGAVLICLYYGGDSGFEEYQAVLDHIRTLPVRQFAVQKIEMANATNCAPIFICCEKLQD